MGNELELLLLLLLMTFHGQCVADSLIGLDLGVGMRSRRRAEVGSNSGLPCDLDILGAGGVGKNDLVYRRGVGWVLLDYYETLRLLLWLRLLVGSGHHGRWSTRLAWCWLGGDVLKCDA